MRVLNKKEVLAANFGRDYRAEYFSSQFHVIEFDGDKYITIEIPRIERKMWYDDEYDAPSTAFDSWCNYNYSGSVFDTYDKYVKDNAEYKKIGCCAGNLLHKPIVVKEYEDAEIYAVHFYCSYDDQERICNGELVARFMTDEEAAEFDKIMETLKQKYLKRLQTYYKRYGNKVIAYGYWANR